MLSIQELRSSTTKELHMELAKMRKELVKIRISVKTKHEKDQSKVGKTKHYIARLLTALKEAEQEDAKKTVKKEEVKKEEGVEAEPKKTDQ